MAADINLIFIIYPKTASCHILIVLSATWKESQSWQEKAPLKMFLGDF